MTSQTLLFRVLFACSRPRSPGSLCPWVGFKRRRTPRPRGCGGGGFLDSMRAPAAFAVFCLGATTVGGFGTCGMRCRRTPRTRPRHNAMLRSTGPSWARGVSDKFPLRRKSRRYKLSSLRSGKSDDYVSYMQDITIRYTFTTEVKFRSVVGGR